MPADGARLLRFVTLYVTVCSWGFYAVEPLGMVPDGIIRYYIFILSSHLVNHVVAFFSVCILSLIIE